jgi:hypothetical protein
MNHRIKFLKVKIKSLAAEQSIIRMEKRRAVKSHQTVLVQELNEHRVHVVRPEARAAHMAYGLLRGLTAAQIEPNAKRPIDIKRVNALITKYGERDQREKLMLAA